MATWRRQQQHLLLAIIVLLVVFSATVVRHVDSRPVTIVEEEAAERLAADANSITTASPLDHLDGDDTDEHEEDSEHDVYAILGRLETDAPNGVRAGADETAATTEAADEEQQHRDEVIAYLYRYGYLASQHPTIKALRHALRAFQDTMGLRATGEGDPDTRAAMLAPRCVHQDMKRTHHRAGRGSRKRRFVLANSSRWPSRHFTAGDHTLRLKWFVSEYTRDLPKSVIRSTISKAFALWSSQVTIRQLPPITLKFEEAANAGEADIEILWAEGDHQDDFKFDGQGVRENVLAHTFFPDYKPYPRNGDIHFDDAETWAIDPSRGTFFPFVLAHEIGHALGLQHSRKATALMQPRYKQTPLDQIQLDVDDKCAVNWNYVGPSNFCLFVWLISEIVPLHGGGGGGASNGLGADAVAAIANSNRDGGASSVVASSDPTSVASLARALHSTRVPRCLASNSVRAVAQEKLQRSLHFPPTEASKYTEVVCNFLDGLHRYRGEENGQRAFIENAGPEWGPSHPLRLKRMVKRAVRVLTADYFDRSFFDDFFAAIATGGT